MSNPSGQPLAGTMAPALPKRNPLLADLEPLHAVLSRWIAQQTAAPAGAWWAPAQLAAAADDRTPALAGDGWLDRGEPWHTRDGLPSYRVAETARGPIVHQRPGQRPPAALQQHPLPLGWPGLPAAATDTPLGLSPEGKYALARYSVAIGRIDEAYDILEHQLAEDVIRHPHPQLWDRLHAMRRRREGLRLCTTGHLRVLRFACRCCGGRQHGVPAQCNSRVCPRCVRDLRRANQRRIATILEHVEDVRRRAGRPLPRWRFLTLSAPSWSSFGPMRRALGAAWGRFMRRDVWAPVRAAVASWETTHTERGWHVHMHAAVDAYLPRDRVAASWAAACLVEWANAVGRGEQLQGLPGDAGEMVDAMRARSWDRRRFAAAARKLQRWAERHRVELRDAVRDPRAAECFRFRASRDVGRRRRVRVLVRDLRPHFVSFVDAMPSPAGVNVKEFGGRGTPGETRAHVLRELAKYCAKDLGGAQAEGQTWGVAGTPQRLAEWIAGTFRWHTLRTYGDAFDRPEPTGAMQCEACQAEGTMVPDGAEFVTPQEAAALEQRRRVLAERRRKLARERWGDDIAGPRGPLVQRGDAAARHRARSDTGPPDDAPESTGGD